MNMALSDLWMFTGEMFNHSSFEKELNEVYNGIDPSLVHNDWDARINKVFSEAGLEIPSSKWNQSGGKEGRHTEYMGYILAEMQHLQRAYPNATW